MTASEYLSTEVFGTDFDDLETALQNYAEMKCKQLLSDIGLEQEPYNDWYFNEYRVLTSCDLKEFCK